MTDSKLSVSWRTVAIGSGLLNLGAIAAITALAASRTSDIRSTVALSLAVIAFICQLIIFSIQTYQSTQQLDEARHINAETGHLIGEARARIEGTNQMVSSQYRALLHLSALKAGSVDSEDGVASGGSENADRVAAAVERAVLNVGSSHPAVVAPSEPVRRVAPGDIDWVNRQHSWPDSLSDAREALGLIKELDHGSIDALVINALGAIISRLASTESSMPYARSDEPLIDHGLAWQTFDENGDQVVALTSKGFETARLLIAEDPIPPRFEEISDEIESARSKISSRTSRNIGQTLATVNRAMG